MKKLFATVLAAATLLTANAADFETATDAVKHMGPGINLANSLECHSRFVDLMMIEKCNRVPTNYVRDGGWSSANMPYLTTFANGGTPTIADYETAWEQPRTTRALIRLWKAAGFSAVRVPVTWYPHMDIPDYLASISNNSSVNSLYSSGNPSFMTYYGINGNGGTWDRKAWITDTHDKNIIDAAWMARVKEVVDMVIEEGMYCIINVHHDTGADQHEAPQGTKNEHGNSRWINANFEWWPNPSASSVIQRAEGDEHTTVIKVVNTGNGTNAWDTQLTFSGEYLANTQYTVTFDVYSLYSGKCEIGIQDYSNGNSVYNGMDEVNTTGGEWVSITRSVTLGGHTCPDLCLNLNVNRQANTYYFDNVKVNGQPAATPTLGGNGGTLNTNCDFTNEDLTTPDPGTNPDPNAFNTQHTKDKYIAIWQQVATAFGDYDDHLLFEGYNEVLDGLDWEHRSSEGQAVTADMAKTFVNVVRGTAAQHPNNGVRNLIIPTYYASNVGITVPTDNTTDNQGHLITEVHCYPNIGTNIGYNNSDTSVDGALAYVNNDHFNAISWMGLPVILGEWGSTDIFKYDVFRDGSQDGTDNRALVAEFSEALYSSLKTKDRAGFIWRSLCDEGHRGYTDGSNVVAPTWNPTYVGIKDAIMKGYYGANGYDGVDYGVYPNLYTVYSGVQTDVDNYAGRNRLVNLGSSISAASLTITDAVPYRLLDDKAYTTVFAPKLTFTRQFKHKEWMPLYVPFQISYDTYKDVAEFAVFKGLTQSVETVDGANVVTLTISVEKLTTGSIPANTPSLIKLKNQGSVNPDNFSYTNPYTFEMVAQYATLTSSAAEGTSLTSNEQGGITWTLAGTYEPIEEDDLADMFAMTEGKFRACKTDGSDILNPNRVYLKVNNSNPSAAPMKLNVVVNSDDPDLSGIADIVAAPHDNVYYDLMGRPVAHPTHGFYIHNGQKVFIR